jgi:aerobic-type carbon monoxide dehydrogenase small subunit (CoxS/CutS family)
MASKLKIKVNGLVHNVTASLDTPLLYVLHNELHLHGPRFGCGLAQCGACSVLLDGKEIRSCVTPVAAVSGKAVTTLEGMPALYAKSRGASSAVPALHPLQQAWIEVQVPQCGTCTSIHACCSGCSDAGAEAEVARDCANIAPIPSSVVIALPLTAATGVTQERISLPSSSTEHAPHCARPQPKRGPCRCNSLCRTYRSGVSRLAVTLCTRPFTLIFNLLANFALLLASGGTKPARITGSRADDGGVQPRLQQDL